MTTKKTEEKSSLVSPEEIRMAYKREREKDADKCRALIKGALDQYRCGLVPKRTESPNGVSWAIDTVPLDD